MNQLELFEAPAKKPTGRTCSDNGLYNGALIALRSGAQPKELYEIAERAFNRGRVNQTDYNAAIKAVEKAQGSL